MELTAQGTGWVKNKLWTDRADLGHVDLIAKVHLQGIATTEDETHRLQPGDAQVVSFISLQDQYVLGMYWSRLKGPVPLGFMYHRRLVMTLSWSTTKAVG